MWYVVISDDWYSVVPDSWVFESESTIWWPPKGISVTTAISKALQPSDTWTVTSYNELIGPIDSFQEARRIEKKSVYISSGADTDAMRAAFDEPSKRPKKAQKISDPPPFIDDSDDSSSNISQISHQSKGKITLTLHFHF
ncbi:uncharacterized protein [Linepithema humile]|uniref:uncharacterized protein n=1 Tax=Linepithema humile TaxID=83485 RepID=UPI00351F0F2D